MIKYKNKLLIEPDFYFHTEKDIVFISPQNISKEEENEIKDNIIKDLVNIEYQENLLMLETLNYSFLFNLEKLNLINSLLNTDKTIFYFSFIIKNMDEVYVFEVINDK